MNAPNSNLAETKTLLADMAREAADLKKSLGASVTDAVAGWLASQYFTAAHEKLAGTNGARRFEILRAFAQDWSLLRRGDHSAARLQLDREEFDWLRANTQTEKEKQFWEWTKRPQIRKKLFPKRKPGLTEKQLKRIEKELNLL